MAMSLKVLTENLPRRRERNPATKMVKAMALPMTRTKKNFSSPS